MPELPDLQVFSKNLNSIFAGKKLLKIKILNTKKIKDKPEDLSKNLEGNILTSVSRTGKELRFLFANGALLGMHLMLHGNLYLFEKDNENKFTVAELYFENKGLALTDWQGLANITLHPEEKKGIDALSNQLNYDYLKRALQCKAKVKNVITNQDVIRGIGNAYADEILWEARISPFSICSAISENKIHALEKAIKTVLKNAEKQILKKHPDIITGEIRDFLKIHTKEKDVSPDGAVIKADKKGGRITYYTDEQELFL
ncbi:DNA-formamidopyrimidine glycosylase family protein [Segetibacter koreensis]|uniref:DNA-formamidopyrimidine glycosylase family protein n=1 Tax=Segetibacter koreensis TaxID=398037 RepID=UPI000370C04D|nr:DNA-formamidopyrimidine glycosylase family protein [Segetibacter koreensis]